MLKYEVVDNHKTEWVVFVHGLGGSTKTWEKQKEEFSEHYNLLLLDLPGHGLNADNIIHKVDSRLLHKGIKDVLDYLGIQNAHFVGLSLGTIVIVNFAVCYPDYVKTIVLGGSTLKISGIPGKAIVLANKAKHIVPHNFLYKIFAWFIMPKKHHQKSRSVFLREAIKLHKETMFAWIDYLQISLHPEQILKRLDLINKQILLISGDEDYCFLNNAKSIAQKMKNTSINIIEKCGHICTIEKSKIFNSIALSYLKSAKT